MMRTCGCYLGPTPFPGQEPCEIGYAVDGDRDGEVSPRVNRTDEERATQARAPKGRIFVRTSSAEANTGQGLFGQVVINANDEHAGQPPLDYWGGEVMIGDDPLIVPHIFDPLIPNKFVLRTPALMGDLPIDLAPYYDRRSDTNPSDFAGGAPGLGYEGLDGGAVGLVPYKLHATDSRPSNDPAWSASIPTLIQVNVIDFDLWWPDPSPGMQETFIFARFYGPVKPDSCFCWPDFTGVTVQYSAAGDFSDTADFTANFRVHFRSDVEYGSYVLGRDVIVRPICKRSYPLSGVYRMVPNDPTVRQSKLVCKLTTGVNQPPLVQPFAFYFRIDTEKFNLADVAELGGNPGPDGQVTPDDLIFFLNAFFAPDYAVADIASLGGDPYPDGQLTADDIVLFLSEFFSNEHHAWSRACAPGELPPVGCGENCGGGGAMRMAAGGSSGSSSSAAPATDSASARRTAAVTALRFALGITIADNATPDQMIEAVMQYFNLQPLSAPPPSPVQQSDPASP